MPLPSLLRVWWPVRTSINSRSQLHLFRSAATHTLCGSLIPIAAKISRKGTIPEEWVCARCQMLKGGNSPINLPRRGIWEPTREEIAAAIRGFEASGGKIQRIKPMTARIPLNAVGIRYHGQVVEAGFFIVEG